MSTPAKRRLLKDLEEITQSSIVHNIFAEPLENDLYTWVAVITGPRDSIYEGGFFSLVLLFDEEYPQHAPEVSFISKMFHPNIYENGDICLDILKNKWSPSYSITSLLLSIQNLLTDPNVNSPANSDAAMLFEHDKETYEKRVKETVELSWSGFEEL
ncbi:ubiquitin-conjugating enzyme E2 [Enterocytozoon bieneusi H348]|nr:ubiquitin-conjugating enzyme E2 [Enterocytozoon bieneusi H348]|eukprot:XP_002649453.1 ubiquitin-conjugating enzyme E2 [Enterocytozoon bieneusi H348]